MKKTIKDILRDQTLSSPVIPQDPFSENFGGSFKGLRVELTPLERDHESTPTQFREE